MDVWMLLMLLSVMVFEKVLSVVDVMMLNFVFVYCWSLGKLFYVILYCIDVRVVIDLKFIWLYDVIVEVGSEGVCVI